MHKCADKIFNTKGTDEGSRGRSLDFGRGAWCRWCRLLFRGFTHAFTLSTLSLCPLALYHLAHYSRMFAVNRAAELV